ncbi:MAG: hypothetical protein AABZ39_15075, partial [Spirochaetota bacterium]
AVHSMQEAVHSMQEAVHSMQEAVHSAVPRTLRIPVKGKRGKNFDAEDTENAEKNCGKLNTAGICLRFFKDRRRVCGW